MIILKLKDIYDEPLLTVVYSRIGVRRPAESNLLKYFQFFKNFKIDIITAPAKSVGGLSCSVFILAVPNRIKDESYWVRSYPLEKDKYSKYC